MSLLFKNLRIHQIFGANTDVGKTVLTSALVRASAANGHSVYYLKPVSTGPISDADDERVLVLSGQHKEKVHSKCLYRFDDPVSPHLAARRANKNCEAERVVPTDDAFVNAVASHIRTCVNAISAPSHMYVETAGGVHSPTLSGTTQLDSYRPLFLPSVLIGDSRLGGISSTIASYEAMMLRGYVVDAVLVFKDEYYRNWEYLSPYFAARGIPVTSVQPPPDRHVDASTDAYLTEEYFQDIIPTSKSGPIFDLINHLDACHSHRISELDSMSRRALDSIWWPFVQHGHVRRESDVNIIDSAWGDFFSVYNGLQISSASSKFHDGAKSLSQPVPSLLEPQFDGSASWWTQALGHAHPSLTLAAARAAGRYGHVMFPEAAHLPALKLAERLIHKGPGRGWASRAFFSDDGSTGMEVAIKMALRAFATREHGSVGGVPRKDLGILGLKGSYHGDTIGAMDACEEGVYTCEWHDAKGYWFDPPTVSIRKGRTIVSLPPSIAAETEDGAAEVPTISLSWTYNIEERLRSPLAAVYQTYIERTVQRLKASNGPTIAALVLEPLVMGAGGMIFVDPLFQRVLIDVVRSSTHSTPSSPSEWSGLPVIFDEVFVGLYRLGLPTTTHLLGATPDISVNAKILTGGLVPLAVTLASDSIYRAFLSDNKVDALLHGHSYTAYPVGCEVAHETLEIVDRLARSDAWTDARARWNVPEPASEQARERAVWSFWDPEFVNTVSRMEHVAEVMTFGTVLSIKIKDNAAGYQSHSARTLLESIRTAIQAGHNLSPAPGGSPFGIHYRTLGNVAYFMLSLNTPPDVVCAVERRVWKALSENRPQSM